MASSDFTNITALLATGAVNFSTDTFKALLVNAVPSEANLDAWAARSDVTSECTGTGYTAGGFSVTASVGALDTTNNRTAVTYSAASPTLTTTTISGYVGCIIYKSTGTASTDKLLHYVDFGGSASTSAQNLIVTFTAPFYINR